MADTKFKKGEPRPANAGRKKGSKNLTTIAVKEAILQALENVGGVKYLENLAEKDPRSFVQLVGKVVPAELKADLGASALQVTVRDYSGLNREEAETNGHTSQADDAQSNGHEAGS